MIKFELVKSRVDKAHRDELAKQEDLHKQRWIEINNSHKNSVSEKEQALQQEILRLEREHSNNEEQRI